MQSYVALTTLFALRLFIEVRKMLKSAKPLIFLYSPIIIANSIHASKILHNRSIMQVKKLLKLSKYQQLYVIILWMFLIGAQQAQAQNLDAGFVMNKMTSDQQVSYVAGIVEGLAFSRWQRDKPNGDGVKCIYDWHGKKGIWNKIEQWFGRHPDKQPGPLLYILIKKECGA